jgi:hypothetical protein
MNSTKQSSSPDANSSSATKEIPSLLWNLEAYFHVYKSLTWVPVLRQMNTFQSLQLCLRSILISSSHECLLFQEMPSLQFSGKNFVKFLTFPMCSTCPSYVIIRIFINL